MNDDDMYAHCSAILVAAAIVLSTACSSPSEPTPAPTRPTPGAGAVEASDPAPAERDAKAEPAPAVAKVGSPGVAPTEPTPAIIEPMPAVPPASMLRLVAVREGPVELLRQRDAPLLAIDGEPLTLDDGEFVRHAVGSDGLWPDEPVMAEQSLVLAAASLPDELGAWTSTVHEIMRSASYYEVYRRERDQWKRVPLRKGLLVAYYGALVERDGALLALQQWAADPAQEHFDEGGEDPKAAAYQTKLTRALARAKPQWVRIAGAEDVALPEIPEGVTLLGPATTTADGTLVALAEAAGATQGGTGRSLLRWRAGQATAERVEVPDLSQTRMITLDVSGEWVLASGSFDADDTAESYLALGRGSAWERVPVSLPGRSSSAPTTISGAARLADGELWIGLGSRFEGGDAQAVWRKPVDGAWEPVPLPAVASDAFGPAQAWVRDTLHEDRGWVAATRTAATTVPEQATRLLAAGGAVWVVVQGQVAFDDVGDPPWRTVVLTTAAGTAPPTVLPAAWQLRLERKNHALRSSQPGGKGCEGFSIVLGAPGVATFIRDKTSGMVHEELAKLEIPDEEHGHPAKIRSIYTALHEGVEVAVADAQARSPAKATALRDAVVKRMDELGAPTKKIMAQCEIPLVERMIHAPAE